MLAAGVPDVGIGWLGVAFAFGLTVLTMAYALGHISGGHFNPAVTLGLTLARRSDPRDFVPYVVTQVVAAIAASGVLYVIANGAPDFSVDASGFAANGYGDHSPGGYSLTAALVAEVVMTAGFLIVIIGATDRRAPKGMAPLAIGLSLTLIHLMHHPGHERLGEPCSVDGAGPVRGRLGPRPALAVLGRTVGRGALAGLGYKFLTGDTGEELVAEEGQDVSTAEQSVGELPLAPGAAPDQAASRHRDAPPDAP